MALLLCWLMVGLKLQVGPLAFTSQWHETVYWNHPPETMTEDLLVDSSSSPEVAARYYALNLQVAGGWYLATLQVPISPVQAQRPAAGTR